MLRFWAKMLAVGLGQVALQVGLYGAAVYKIVSSELPVLGLPTLLAFGVFAFVLWRDGLSQSRLAVRLVLTPVLAFLALALSSTAMAMIAFNLWGT